MSESTRFLIALFMGQAAGALVLAGLLFGFHRHYGRGYLLHWALSWLALFVYLAGTAGSLGLMTSRPADDPTRIALALAASIGGYLQIVWLLAGAYELSRKAPVSGRAIALAVPLAVALATVTTLAFVHRPELAALRRFVGPGFRAMLLGLAFLVGAAGVWPSRTDPARVGRRLLSVGFLLFGLEALQYFAFSVLAMADRPAPAYGRYLGALDVLLGWIIGLAMVMCLLEEERAAAVRSARRAEHLAYHDALTGLPNRRLLLDRLEVALSQAERTGDRVAVVFVDLDRFKVINDSLGHGTGDRLLTEAGERIRTAVRSGDTLARIGGDEFTLLLPRIHSPDDAAAVARKVLEVVRAPFRIGGQEIFVTASAGIGVAPEDGPDAETLIKHADIAMYRAKEAGRDAIKFFHPEMNERARERLELESCLRRALPQGQLRLVYQPVVEIASGRVIAAEALLRWDHPERGELAPAEFLELAEATGLIVPIGGWALREACATAAAWRRERDASVALLVNLSLRQFQDPSLVEEVRLALKASALPPELLELEVTESMAMRDAAATEGALWALKALGVRISIDDFGTGYSSFLYLRRFPVDTLKIDRGFTAGVDASDGSDAIAGAMIAMAHRLGLRVIAEGVERAAQLDFLRAQGCDAAQGYLLGRPMLVDDLAPLLGRVCTPALAAD